MYYQMNEALVEPGHLKALSLKLLFYVVQYYYILWTVSA